MIDKRNEKMTMPTQQTSAISDQPRGERPNTDSYSVDRYAHNTAGQLAGNHHRAVAYSILAALLRQSPGQEVLNIVSEMADAVEQKDDLAIAMSMLGLSARAATPAGLDDEYHALFIGIGRGELVPYGSWYLTGFLMEKPLVVLREDLSAMGYERNQATCEPEDHIAALCEVMALLINEARNLDAQSDFFNAHIASWVDRFFIDLGDAKSAVFYRSVARFGKAFFDFEQQYLAMGE